MKGERASGRCASAPWIMEKKHTLSDLRQMQSLPLSAKIQMTRQRIRGWIDEFGEDGVYVSFSGGKDSTVLLDIVRNDYPDVEAVFLNTGLEYPSVRKFAESKDNVTTLRPKMDFRNVLIKYGYPIISKEVSEAIAEVRTTLSNPKWNGKKTVRMKQLDGEWLYPQYDKSKWKYLLNAPFKISNRCCDVMKKSPAHSFQTKENKQPFIATMTEESRLRRTNWQLTGCNAFNGKYPRSNPMAFWTENDVLTYIRKNNLQIAEAYGEIVIKGTENGQLNIADIILDYRDCQYCTTGCKRTGCIFCMFGITQDKKRFVILKQQEPQLYDYVMRGGEFNSQGMWQPSNNGLGYKFVIDWLNEHGKLGIEY